MSIMHQQKQDVHVFLGDGTSFESSIWQTWSYNKLSCSTPFRNLLDNVNTVLSVWDGRNAKLLFMDFWKVSEERKTTLVGIHRFRHEEKTMTLLLLDHDSMKWSFIERILYEYADLTIIVSPVTLTQLDRFWNLPKGRVILVSGSPGYGEIAYQSGVFQVTVGNRVNKEIKTNPYRIGDVVTDMHWGELVIDWNKMSVLARLTDKDARTIIQRRIY